MSKSTGPATCCANYWPLPPVKAEKVLDALVKTGKVVGPIGVTSEMLNKTGQDAVEMLRHLGEYIFNHGSRKQTNY